MRVSWARVHWDHWFAWKPAKLSHEIDRLQDRGTFFIDPGQDIYIGQVIGECARENDMNSTSSAVRN